MMWNYFISINKLLLSLLVLQSFNSSSALNNIKVEKIVSLEKLYERHLNSILVKNTALSKVNAYEFVLPLNVVSRLSSISFETTNGTILPHTKDSVSKENEHQTFKVEINLLSEEKLELKARYNLLPEVHPKPLNSKIGNEQLFSYKYNIAYLSVYPTKEQSFKLKLPGSKVESYTKYGEVELKEKQLIYSNIKDIKALTIVEGEVHFENKQTQLRLNSVYRDIELSNWNDDAWVEESYDLRNMGPRVESYSRIDHAMNVMVRKSNMVEQLKLQYKYPISSPYYTDQIGNVSTSNFHTSKTKAHLFIKPRYPIYGQWKYQFKVGYHVGLSNLIKRTGDTYELNMEYLNSFKNIPIDKAITRFVLPEGAKLKQTEIEVEGYTLKSYTHYTYFDYIGRVAIEISSSNIIDAQAGKNIKITYKYTTMDKIIKLRTFFVSMCLLLAVVSAGSRVVGGIKKSKLI